MDYAKEIQRIADKLAVDFYDVYADLNEVNTNDLYDEMLDEIYGPVNLCGYEYCASKVFEDTDPIAYRCSFDDYIDSITGEEIETLDDRNTYYYCHDLDALIEEHAHLFEEEEQRDL